MKRMMKMLSILIVSLFSFMMITDASIKENDNYSENTYIIGYSRFSGGKAITADMAAKAGQYYERIYPQINMGRPDDVKVYMKNTDDGAWYATKTGLPLSETETKELTENLLVFFVDEVEKVHKVPFSGVVDEGSLPKGVTYKDGEFIVPASFIWFDFFSNGEYVSVDTKFEDDEHVFGDYIINVPEPPVDIKEKMVSQAKKIVETYYNKKSETIYNDVIDEYYVNVGKYEGEALPESISINDQWYAKDEISSLSVGLSSFIKVPIWKIDNDNNVLVALPWLAADSLPNGVTTISFDENVDNDLYLLVYDNDSEKHLNVSSANSLFTVSGYTNEIVSDILPGNNAYSYHYTSGHGHHGYGLVINNTNGPITSKDQIIFRKDNSNNTMGITFPEMGYTYVSIPKWQNSPFTEQYFHTYDYKLAIPGEGVVNIVVNFNVTTSPVDLREKMVSQAEKIVETYYNKKSETIYNEVIDEYYVNIGKYRPEDEPTTLTINGYGEPATYNIDDVSSLSVGLSSFIKVPIWKVDNDNNVLVALPWLAADSLPNGTTTISVSSNITGQNFDVLTYNDDSEKNINISDYDALFTVPGYVNKMEFDGSYHYTSGHGQQGYGLVINNTNGPITSKDQIIFRKDNSNNTMGITFPEMGYTYVSIPKWQNAPYDVDYHKNTTYKLAIPGEGVLFFDLYFEQYGAPIDLNEKIESMSVVFRDTFYKKYNEGYVTINDELFDKYYIEVGTYTGAEESPTLLSIGENSYDSGVDYNVSIGNNAFVQAPVWKIVEGKIYIALPWLATDSLPNGITEIMVGGQTLKLKTYPSDEDKILTIADVQPLSTVSGYANSVNWDGGNNITHVSGHGHHILGIKLKNVKVISENEVEETLIDDLDQIIFRKDSNGNMGVTLPDKIGQDVYTYALYPKWQNGEYTEMSAIDYEYKLAIPGHGTIDININYVMYPNN